MGNKDLNYENYLMACLGDIEERWKIISDLKIDIEIESEGNENLKMTMLLDMEKSFDEIDKSYTAFRKNSCSI